MVKSIYVDRELEGVMFDAQRLIHDNRTLEAFNLLAKRLLRIKKYELNTDYKLVWKYDMTKSEKDGVDSDAL